MMSNYAITAAVQEVLNNVKFEKVSDLSKEQFAEILSESIYRSILTRDFIDHIESEIAMNSKRRSF